MPFSLAKVLLRKSRLPVALGAFAASAMLNAGNTKAVLIYELIPGGSDVRVSLSGSLSGLPAGTANSYGFTSFQPNFGVISFGTFVGNS
jgi:hypothetical protein